VEFIAVDNYSCDLCSYNRFTDHHTVSTLVRRARAARNPLKGELVLAPSGPAVDNAMVKAIARAFRWREMLEGGHATIAEIVRPK
jgi:hypothetical protein